MNLQVFASAAALHAFVVAQVILQPKIVAIKEVDGQWFLFWYS